MYLIIKSRYVVYVELFEVFILLPFLATCKISMVSSMDAMECPFSMKRANFDFPFLYLKFRKCSWNLFGTVCWFVLYIYFITVLEC